MSRLVRYFHTVIVLAGITWYIFTKHQQRQRYLTQTIKKLLPGMVLPDRIERRFKKYIPVFLGIEYLYQQFTGRALEAQALHRSALLSGLTPLFDDLIDDYGHSADYLLALAHGTEPPHEPEAVCAVALFNAADFVWDEHCERILIAQVNSSEQKSDQITYEQLWTLTREKGGASVVLGWHLITGAYGGTLMNNASYELGAYVQIVNDIFDVYKDREAHIATLVTHCTDVPELTALYRDFYQRLLAATHQIQVPGFRKWRLKALLALLHAMTELVLEQLLATQRKYGGSFAIHQYTRQELVLDMSRWDNRLKWGWKVLTHP